MMESKMAHIRPTTIPEMLDRQFYVLAAKPKVFFGLAAIYAATDYIVRAIIPPGGEDAVQSAVFFSALALYIIGEWACAAAAAAAFQVVLFPARPISLNLALMSALPKLPHFLFTRIILTAIIGGLIYALPAMLLEKQGPANISWPTITAAVLSVFAGIYLATHWVLASTLVMVEGRYLISAAKRSMEIMRLRFGRLDTAIIRLLAVLVVPGVIALSLIAGLEAWTRYRYGQFIVPCDTDVRFAFPLRIANCVISLFCSSLVWAGVALVYSECRIRNEGLDFQVRLIDIGATVPDPAESDNALKLES